mgnify:CR=1 FL=1
MTVTPPEPGRLVFSVEEVAERLGVHPNTVRDMIHEGAFRARQVGRVWNSGTIRAVRAGRTWKVPLSALEEFLAGRDNPPTEEAQPVE